MHKLAKVAADIRGVQVVTVTGGQSIEAKQAEIAKYAESDTTLVVIATPGVMDSGVTIPGATRGMLVDERLTVIENQHGRNELVRGENGINHIWQMLRRLGRQPRPEGDPD